MNHRKPGFATATDKTSGLPQSIPHFNEGNVIAVDAPLVETGESMFQVLSRLGSEFRSNITTFEPPGY